MPWTCTHRLMVSLPIFIILIGVLVSISNLTTVPWNIEPPVRRNAAGKRHV